MEPMDSSRSEASPRPRRPRGFAATSALDPASATPGVRREREKEKERTKLRERHRRAITSRILSGLRQHGNFLLPARADMNDVLAALAREAGWTVEPDGTTYRNSAAVYCSVPGLGNHRLGVSASSSAEPGPASVCENSLGESTDAFHAVSSSLKFPTVQFADAKKFTNNGNGLSGNRHVPVYATLSADFINNFCELINTQFLREELSHLKSLNIDGVAVKCWWGIVEAWNPQKYNWTGYRELFTFIREFNFKLQIIIAFHEYEGNDADDAIALPHWISEIGKDNPDIFFTDREGRRNKECLSWSIDKERVLRGRTAIEVYSDFMRSLRTEFADLFSDHLISSVEIGLGPCGELKYPSFSFGWNYPGVGEFQCYDKYFLRNLRKASESRRNSNWGRIPDNAGHYNSRPDETGFFRDRGDYDSYYGRFFLRWYTQLLITHAENVLSLAALTFPETKMIVKIPAVYWWYRTASHAAELTAGYYNSANHDGYSPVFAMLKKYSATAKIVCNGMHVSDALADVQGLNWQIVNAAWDEGVEVGGVNVICCYEDEEYRRVVEMLKAKNDEEDHQFLFFQYQQPSPLCQGATCFANLVHFISCMHGELSDDDLLA